MMSTREKIKVTCTEEAWLREGQKTDAAELTQAAKLQSTSQPFHPRKTSAKFVNSDF